MGIINNIGLTHGSEVDELDDGALFPDGQVRDLALVLTLVRSPDRLNLQVVADPSVLVLETRPANVIKGESILIPGH